MYTYLPKFTVKLIIHLAHKSLLSKYNVPGTVQRCWPMLLTHALLLICKMENTEPLSFSSSSVQWKSWKKLAWWCMTVTPAFWRPRQEGSRGPGQLGLQSKFKASLSYIVRNCLKTKQQAGAMAHTCNLSYWGGRDQEDPGLKPALGK
jgi:hypothetical protein